MIELNFEKLNGLLPIIVQDFKTNNVLMLGFMNKEAWEKTLETGKVNYFSRSRNKIWQKGEISGNFQIVKEIFVDCDKDTLLIKAEQVGNAACHEGYGSCFYRKLNDDKLELVGKRIFDPYKVYRKGVDKNGE
ncbi:MAG: phosphoribosyl-AMP cyclohydrolase [Nanoarchaeota archaeon]|nr:phosphoribosyl-AMP cyclohydrolase [Nanoarchaeota archaeon]